MRGRIVDVGSEVDGVLVTRASSAEPADTPLPDADYVIPRGPVDAVVPTTADPDAEFAPAVAEAVESLFDRSLGLEFEEGGLFG